MTCQDAAATCFCEAAGCELTCQHGAPKTCGDYLVCSKGSDCPPLPAPADGGAPR